MSERHLRGVRAGIADWILLQMDALQKVYIHHLVENAMLRLGVIHARMKDITKQTAFQNSGIQPSRNQTLTATDGMRILMYG